MFKSRAVAKVNPSDSCKTVLILGIGNGFLTSHLFTSLKSLMKHMVLSFLSIATEITSNRACLRSFVFLLGREGLYNALMCFE